jgi:hypothetical protein
MSDLIDKRSGAYDRGTDVQKTISKADSKLTEHQRGQWGADVREGVPTLGVVPGDYIPEDLQRERKGAYSKRTGRSSR